MGEQLAQATSTVERGDRDAVASGDAEAAQGLDPQVVARTDRVAGGQGAGLRTGRPVGVIEEPTDPGRVARDPLEVRPGVGNALAGGHGELAEHRAGNVHPQQVDRSPGQCGRPARASPAPEVGEGATRGDRGAQGGSEVEVVEPLGLGDQGADRGEGSEVGPGRPGSERDVGEHVLEPRRGGTLAVLHERDARIRDPGEELGPGDDHGDERHRRVGEAACLGVFTGRERHRGHDAEQGELHRRQLAPAVEVGQARGDRPREVGIDVASHPHRLGGDGIADALGQDLVEGDRQHLGLPERDERGGERRSARERIGPDEVVERRDRAGDVLVLLRDLAPHERDGRAGEEPPLVGERGQLVGDRRRGRVDLTGELDDAPPRERTHRIVAGLPGPLEHVVQHRERLVGGPAQHGLEGQADRPGSVLGREELADRLRVGPTEAGPDRQRGEVADHLAHPSRLTGEREGGDRSHELAAGEERLGAAGDRRSQHAGGDHVGEGLLPERVEAVPIAELVDERKARGEVGGRPVVAGDGPHQIVVDQLEPGDQCEGVAPGRGEGPQDLLPQVVERRRGGRPFR